jgi:hypothetical protein
LSYEAMILLPHARFSLQDAQKLLEARFAGDDDLSVRSGKRLEVKSSDGWALRLSYHAEPSVLEESAEIAQDLRDGKLTGAAPELLERAMQAKLETFPARFELSCKPDPNMDHFNDYLFVLEALQALEGSVAFDHSSGMFV